MGRNESETTMDKGRRLTGWKAIGRHLDRSERAVQSWEVERELPVHRIPGGRGQTVYAYAGELDAWMAHGAHLHEEAGPASLAGPWDTAMPELANETVSPARPPGIVVLPLERHEADPSRSGDAICQKLIARLADTQSAVRVLPWHTSKSLCRSMERQESIAASLQVRYFVEGSIDRIDGMQHVDIRIVDADLDTIVLADHFVSRVTGHPSFADEVAEAVATHFALMHDGALVEPICPTESAPATFLDYLAGVRAFSVGTVASLALAIEALVRAIERDPRFVPARALLGLAWLQSARDGDQRAACSERVRTMADSCGAGASARVTVAFLRAGIAVACDDDRSKAMALLSGAMRRMRPATAARARLYERRSPLRPREQSREPLTLVPSSSRPVDADPGADGGVFGQLMAVLASIDRHEVARRALLGCGARAAVVVGPPAGRLVSAGAAKAR